MFKSVVKKYLYSMAMVILTTVLFSLPVNAETSYGFTVSYSLPGNESCEVKVISKTVDETASYDIKTRTVIKAEQENDGAVKKEYTVFLPYDKRGEKIKIGFTHSEKTFIDGEQIKSGDEFVFDKESYTVTIGGENYPLNVVYSSQIPQVYITLADGALENVHSDKENREPGDIRIVNDNKLEYDGPLEYIKGRGNASWGSAKKPYNIKLATKASLFGMERAKKYVLIADHNELTAAKGKIGLDLAAKAGIDFCSDSQPVDLYINGEYRGLYLFTEKVEVAEGRIDIFDLDIINEQTNPGVNPDECTVHSVIGNTLGKNSDPGSRKWVELPNEMSGQMTGGYLLETELGFRWAENTTSGFVSDYGQPMAIKSPEYATGAQVGYIAGYYQQFENALLSHNGYNEEGRHYSEYIDVDSFVNAYMFQEYTKNVDAAITSCYLYKNIGGKLTACSQWDMDLIFGEDLVRRREDFLSPENLWVTEGKLFDSSTKRTIFALLCRYPEFRREVAQHWNEYFSAEAEEQYNLAEDLFADIARSSIMDKYIWNADIPREQAAALYNTMSDRILNFMADRREYLNGVFDNDALYVAYRPNGGDGPTQDNKVYKAGDTTVVLENEYENSGKAFLGWNTQPDGSGAAYREGDEITVTEDVYLYAQWEGGSDTVPAQTESQPGFFEKIINWLKGLF